MTWESRLVALLAASLVRPFVLAAAAGLVLRLLRVRHPASRHAVWSVVLASLLLLPLVSVTAPHWGLPVLPRKDDSARVLKASVVVTQEPVQVVESSEASPGLSQVLSPGAGFRTPSFRTLLVWCYLAGLSAMLLYRAAGWLMLRRVLARSTPLKGRALRESRDVMSPVAGGVLRPAVILPIGWRAWNPETRRAVLAHELAHIRRRDTLISALGRVVKSVLWFHPLAWWVSRHVSELAELACDAVALERLRDPGGYSRILLQFASGVNRAGGRVALPGLAMAATSSGMAHRIDQVFELSRGGARKLTRPGALLALIGLPVMALAATIGLGESSGRSPALARPPVGVPPIVSRSASPAPQLIAQVPAPRQARPAAPVQLAPAAAQIEPKLEFEVASVRPDGPVFRPGPGRVTGGPGTSDPTRITYDFATLKLLVMQAYSMQDFQVSGPSWIESERYTIIAKVPEGTSKEQLSAMLKNLLEERFKVRVHHETKILPVYELTVGKGGSKMRVSPDDPKPMPPDYATLKYVDGIPQFPPGSIGTAFGGGSGVMMAAAHQPISSLISFLQSRLRLSPDDHRPVIDRTGLTGTYDFVLKFTTPLEFLSANPNNDPSDPSLDAFAAVQQYLGLKLEEKKDPLDTLAIDEAAKTPTEN